eukprot:TRINITY_DN9672_c0_g1_i1.p1 TRINITY_DN9672_c0_g1~~TRINITY_DN9672_c0_g1_i1.p1  ORF type:complete len:108 (+),score=37.26 TRINITY_DN9672_c0_g1_i1:280-603(+)
MFKSTICLCLLAAAYATPQGGYAVEKLPPKPFNYQYGVSDDYSKANFQKTESQDANGNVIGSFVIALPDGRIQTTKYTADHVQGFVAEVTYQGEAVYPKETKPYGAN